MAAACRSSAWEIDTAAQAHIGQRYCHTADVPAEQIVLTCCPFIFQIVLCSELLTATCRSYLNLFYFCCAVSAHASHRKLMTAKSGGALAVADVNAYAFPHLGFIGGTCTIRNNRGKPHSLNGGAFGLAGPTRVRGALRCPQPIVPAGGSLRCGFVAPLENAGAFTSFTPLFDGARQRVFPVVPVAGPVPAATAVAQATATAVGKAFGPAASSNALAVANAQALAPAAIADKVCSALFGAAFANSEAIARQSGWGDAIAASSSLATATGWSGAGAQSRGSAIAQWGAALGRADAAALGGLGGAAAGAGAFGRSEGGPAGAISSATANPTAGPAKADSGAVAIAPRGPADAKSVGVAITGAGHADAKSGAKSISGGPGSADSKAVAVGTTADADSASKALCGSGPCKADSKAVAQGVLGASASSRSVAQGNGHGPVVATASSVATSGK